MRYAPTSYLRVLPLLALGLLASCKTRAPEADASAVKADPRDRAAVGRPYDYVASTIPEPELNRQLQQNLRARREFTWEMIRQLIEPMRDPAASSALGTFPRWYSLYDGAREIPDMAREFARLANGNLNMSRQQAEAIADQVLDQYNGGYLRRDNRSLEQLVRRFDGRPLNADSAPGVGGIGVENAITGPGVTGVNLFNRAFIRHVLVESSRLIACRDQREQARIANVPSPTNFAECMSQEFPRDALMIKTAWRKYTPGMQIPRFDTSGQAVEELFRFPYQFRGQDTPMDLRHTFNVTLDGDTYVLTAIHFSTKDVREWVWASLWLAPDADQDFGADRPADIGAPWDNYKMCVATHFDEGDPNPASHYDGDRRLASLGQAVGAMDRASGHKQWCSNPFLEVLRGHTDGNCVGCHQRAAPGVHGGPNLISSNPMAREPGRTAFSDDFTFSIRDTFENPLRQAFGMPPRPAAPAPADWTPPRQRSYH